MVLLTRLATCVKTRLKYLLCAFPGEVKASEINYLQRVGSLKSWLGAPRVCRQGCALRL